MRPPLEKDEQQAGIDLLRWLRFEVYVLGTRRSRGRPCPSCGVFVPEDQGTRQTPGLSDVLAFAPPRHGRRAVLWWEAKQVGGRVQPEQIRFRALCLEATVLHSLGPFDVLVADLTAWGYLRSGAVLPVTAPPRERT